MKLQPGQSVNIKVNPRLEWQNTHVEIGLEESYEFVATGWWVDLMIPTNPAGFKGDWYMPEDSKKRVPDSNWLALMGSLSESNDEAFLIGMGCTITFHNSAGTLFLFANDMAKGWFYRVNNWGNVNLQIKRIS